MAGQLEFADLTDYPVMAQALDNQWMPAALAKARQSADAAPGSTPEQLSSARAELRRALVNSGTLVVNRAYFLNAEALYANYLPSAEPAERTAFAGFLNGGTIVPYLLTERDPAEEPLFTHSPQVYRSWRRFLEEEAEPSCVRLSWDDETNRRGAGLINQNFARGVRSIDIADPLLLAESLDLSAEQARAMRGGILSRIARWTLDQDFETVTRNRVYEEFLTRPGSQPHERLLRDGDHIVPAKQLIDLLYNIAVPTATGIIAVTPPDSPPRSALQELNAEQPRTADPEALGNILRGLVADAVHRAVDGPNSYGSLSLTDISALRREPEWRAYIASLDNLVRTDFTAGRMPSPAEFAHSTQEIAEHHARMLKQARRISRGRHGEGFRREFAMSVVLESPGMVLQVMGEGNSLLLGSIQAASALAGPLTIRLLFRDRAKNGPAGALSHSVTLPALRLRSLRRDWAEMVRAAGIDPLPVTGDAVPALSDQQAPNQ